MQIRVWGVPENCRAMLAMAGAVLYAFCNGIYQLCPKCPHLPSSWDRMLSVPISVMRDVVPLVSLIPWHFHVKA